MKEKPNKLERLSYSKQIETYINEFKLFFENKDYHEIPEVPITSNIDPTVRFIGSHISVFKPYLENRVIPNPGIFMKQECIRTHNTKSILDTKKLINWGSTFPSIGVLVPYTKLNKIINESITLLEDIFKIESQSVFINISSSDTDLAKAVEEDNSIYQDNIMYDSKPKKYYRHVLGMDGISGRNFNLAIKSNDKIEDIGNIIVIDHEGTGSFAVELAIGITTVLKCKYNLEHILDLENIKSKNSPEKENSRRRLEDGIITSTKLLGEGLRPFGNSNQSRILKKYIKSIIFHALYLEYTEDEIRELFREDNSKDNITTPTTYNVLYELVLSFQQEIENGKVLSKEDKAIYQLIQNNKI